MKGADLINVALPEELLEDVLRRVGGEKLDLDACALVCRRWRRLDRATRRSAKLPASGVHADEVVGLFVERFPALADVSIDERLSADAAVVSAPASRSRRHVISSIPSGSRSRMSRVPRFAGILFPLPSEQTPSADGIESFCLTDVGLTSLARGCKGLEKLSLVWCSAISSSGLVRVAENCKKLASLDIQACYIGDPGLVAIGEGCNLLNNLSLRFVEGATDEGLIGLIKSCGQSLLSLELVKNEGVISIAKGCHFLKNLKLQCIGAGDEALEAIGSCCSLLEILSLNNFERFTDRSLSSIAKGCKNLTDLVLNDCLLLTDRSLEFVARSCKKIARLKINGCQNMETAALEHIGRWCPGPFGTLSNLLPKGPGYCISGAW
ncbi:unnamed protein product [Triticum turgidum subsp. durum]|uniref:F-box domain-containing protein n=1 Tax=Triticum turgidum subsp. durum TaxID=4567 RepID=A0A9R0VXA6_TRITD|nr:unnamed protein product [Triticum turgidum subsp. durum]